eukprot:2537313-Prymnesium_polylepis.1
MDVLAARDRKAVGGAAPRRAHRPHPHLARRGEASPAQQRRRERARRDVGVAQLKVVAAPRPPSEAAQRVAKHSPLADARDADDRRRHVRVEFTLPRRVAPPCAPAGRQRAHRAL